LVLRAPESKQRQARGNRAAFHLDRLPSWEIAERRRRNDSGGSGSPANLRALLAHDLHDDAFPPAPVELGVVDLLPRTEVHAAVGDGDDHLVVDEQALEMGVAVVFAGAMVPVIRTEGRELVE